MKSLVAIIFAGYAYILHIRNIPPDGDVSSNCYIIPASYSLGNLSHLSYRGILNSPLDLLPCMDWDERERAWKLYADAFKEASVVEKGIMIVLPLVGGIAFYSFLMMFA